MAASNEARTLPVDGRVEMAIVASGARRDIGQPDAAVVALQIPGVGQRAAGAVVRAARVRLCRGIGSGRALGGGDDLVAASRRRRRERRHRRQRERWEELHGVTLVEEPDS